MLTVSALFLSLNIAKNNTTATLAPPVIPMISGEASGFRTRPCKIHPATASAIPTRIAIKIRGIRNLFTTILDIASPFPVIACHTS